MTTARSDLARVVETLRNAERLVVSTHVNPDGDAVGTALGLAHLLHGMGKRDVVCMMQDPVPALYAWLPGADWFISPAGDPVDCDCFVMVDAATTPRLGDAAPWIAHAQTLLTIDHHLEDHPEGDIQFVDPTYAAAGEIVTELFATADVPLTQAAAACLYTAIVTDTGSFQYHSTRPRTHEMAARLVAAGIDVAGISSRLFDSMSPGKYRLLARVMTRTRLIADGRAAYSEVYPTDFDDTGADGDDLNNLANYARAIEGVEVAMVFRSLGPALTKVSLRATPAFDATRVAGFFGGGGHTGAAGATLPLPLHQAKHVVLERVKACFDGAC